MTIGDGRPLKQLAWMLVCWWAGLHYRSIALRLKAFLSLDLNWLWREFNTAATRSAAHGAAYARKVLGQPLAELFTMVSTASSVVHCFSISLCTHRLSLSENKFIVVVLY